jgi:hypothetical protein
MEKEIRKEVGRKMEKKRRRERGRRGKTVRCLRGKQAVTLGYDCDPHLGRATSSYIET